LWQLAQTYGSLPLLAALGVCEPLPVPLAGALDALGQPLGLDERTIVGTATRAVELGLFTPVLTIDGATGVLAAAGLVPHLASRERQRAELAIPGAPAATAETRRLASGWDTADRDRVSRTVARLDQAVRTLTSLAAALDSPRPGWKWASPAPAGAAAGPTWSDARG
jgi:hypothetical protein